MCFVLLSGLAFAQIGKPSKKIPVIFDTDIGDDIDDTWALVLLLKCPVFDVKMVLEDNGKREYRTKLLAKLLQTAGRTDIPIGMGINVKTKGVGPQAEWVKDYDLASYPGKIYKDGVKALIDTIMNSKEKITLIATGPLPNIAEALRREGRIVRKARFVGMHGSVRRGYGGSKKISAEYNVRADVKACQKVLSADWDITITPLDTCGIVHLKGKKYKAVRDCPEKLTRALITNYRIWARRARIDPEKQSTTLFDTVAIYLGFTDELLRIEKLPIRVTDKGFTVIDPEKGKLMRVATEWKDLGAFEDFLVRQLTGPVTKPSRR